MSFRLFLGLYCLEREGTWITSEFACDLSVSMMGGSPVVDCRLLDRRLGTFHSLSSGLGEAAGLGCFSSTRISQVVSFLGDEDGVGW